MIYVFAVVKGSISKVATDIEQQESIINISVDKLYRQKTRIFQPSREGHSWEGQIKTPLECGVKAGSGEFLFTGRMHFGEPRLGCAPRYRDFQRIYQEAKNKGLNPCDIITDWRTSLPHLENILTFRSPDWPMIRTYSEGFIVGVRTVRGDPQNCHPPQSVDTVTLTCWRYEPRCTRRHF